MRVYTGPCPYYNHKLMHLRLLSGVTLDSYKVGVMWG
jgi:hypothetical protein